MIQLPIEIGDTILTGRFKNHKATVKEIGTDEHGLPTINGRGILKIRIEKLMKSKVNEMKESINSSITANFLKSLDPKVKDEILTNIAKHYGISNQEAFEEVTDDEAESIMDYVTGSIRSTVSLLFNKFKGTMNESTEGLSHKDDIINASNLQKGENYVHTGGSEPSMVTYIGPAATSSLYKFTLIDGKHQFAMNPRDIKRFIKLPIGENRMKESNDNTRISKMVSDFKKNGIAISHIDNTDDSFFKKIGISPLKIGTTSRTGNDIIYYDTNLFSSDKDAIRNNRIGENRMKKRVFESNSGIKVKIKEEDGKYWVFLQTVDGEENISNVGYDTKELATHAAYMKGFTIVNDSGKEEAYEYETLPKTATDSPKASKREKTPGTETPKVMDLGKEKVTKLEEMLKRIIKEEISLLKEEPSNPNKFIQYIENASLYGWDDVFDELIKAKFDMVSYNKSSIPTSGSPTIDLRRKRPTMNDNVQVESVKVDKDGNIIVKTNVAYMKFWKDNMKESLVKKKSVPKM